MTFAIAIIFLMLALSAFFSGSEIAFVVANRLRVEVLARRRGVVGRIVSDFIQTPSAFLTTTLVGNNISLVVFSTLTAFYLDPPLHRLWDASGLGSSGVEAAVLITQTLAASALVLVFGEILPKSIMREAANRAVFLLAIPLRISYYLLLPLVKTAAGAATLLMRLFRVETDTFVGFMRRDFEAIIQESRESGELDLDEEETEMLSNVFAMNALRVKESMAPRTEIEAVEEHTPVDALLRRFIETGHSKLPVYQRNIDHIVGMVFAYDLFHGPETMQEIMRPVQFVPAAKRSKDLLREFLETNTSVAIVIDEYGGTAGLVTREDLLEELFGDIQDEFDSEQEVLRQVGENRYIAAGRAEIDELADRFGIALPEGDYETLAGYLLDRIGSIPAPQEHFAFDGYRFDVLKAEANRIELVRLSKRDA